MSKPNYRYELTTHENKHGYGISLTQYLHNSDKLIAGFVLHTCDTKAEQYKYLHDLSSMTGWEIVL